MPFSRGDAEGFDEASNLYRWDGEAFVHMQVRLRNIKLLSLLNPRMCLLSDIPQQFLLLPHDGLEPLITNPEYQVPKLIICERVKDDGPAPESKI